MKYVAIELVTKQDDTFTVNTFKKEEKEEAESAYFAILSSAAKSTNKIHAGVLINQMGQFMESRCFKHEQPEQQEPGTVSEE